MTQALHRLMPEPHVTTCNEILLYAREANNSTLGVGSSDAREFCAKLGHILLNDPRVLAYPELAVLGFWLRPAALQNMLHNLLVTPADTQRMPIGIVFHIPPSNVDTLFLYPALIALLCGNASVIRLSHTQRPIQHLLLTLLFEVLATAPERLRKRLLFIRYGHDDNITLSLSSLCNLRLVWGGDATILHMRQIPLPPLAREIGFGDRFSASLLYAAHYAKATEPERQELIHRFYNDMYWFDQMACSSPRLMAWIGDEVTCHNAEQDFNLRLSIYAHERGYEINAGSNLAKLTNIYLGLHDLNVADYKIYSPTLTTIRLQTPQGFSAFKQVNYGFGLLITAHLSSLDAFTGLMDRRDQTLTHWGFHADDISGFARQYLCHGFERVVPVGEALAFDAVWDGYNLFDIMTRLIRVKT